MVGKVLIASTSRYESKHVKCFGKESKGLFGVPGIGSPARREGGGQNFSKQNHETITSTKPGGHIRV